MMKNLEDYMFRHRFAECDKIKVRVFLYLHFATDAYLTRTALHYLSFGIPRFVSRSYLGLPDDPV